MAPATISVCVATYNQKSYIQQCLESVLQQETDRVIEILVGDDCSDDGTSQMISDYAKTHSQRLRHIRHPMRLGASANIQELQRTAVGEYVAHLDGDDFWLPGKLQLQAEFLDKHPECSAVYTNAIAILEDGNIFGLFNDVGDTYHDLASIFRGGNFLNTSSMVYRSKFKQALIDIDGPFVDYQMHLLLAQTGLLAHLGRPMVAYRINSTGAMTTNSGDLVRELYWKAMCSVPARLIDDTDMARGIADFFRRVFGAARRQHRWELLKNWAPRIFDASPNSKFYTCILVLISIMRIARAEATSRIKGKNRVLYRH